MAIFIASFEKCRKSECGGVTPPPTSPHHQHHHFACDKNNYCLSNPGVIVGSSSSGRMETVM